MLVAVTAALVQCAPDPGHPATPSPATPTAAEPAPETFRTVPRPPPTPPAPTAGPAITFCNTGHWASLGWFVNSELLGNKKNV